MDKQKDIVRILLTIGIVLIVAFILVKLLKLTISIIVIIVSNAFWIGALLIIIALIIYWINKNRGDKPEAGA